MAASRYSLRRIGSDVGALSLGLVKDHLRVDGDEEDDLILNYLDAAVGYCETFTGRSIADSTWRLTTFSAPPAILLLPRPPVLSVERVSFLLPDGPEEVDPSEYTVELDADDEPGVLHFRAPPRARVRVEYRAGYETRADMPGAIRSALLLMVGHLYANREDVVLGVTPSQLPQGTNALLWGERVFGV